MDWSHLLRSLRPNQIRDSITDVDFAALHASGKRYFIIDVDNTLAEHKSLVIPPPVCDYIQTAVAAGHIEAGVLLSNIVFESGKRRRRVAAMANQLGWDYYCARFPYAKPHRHAFEQAFKGLPEDATALNTVMIGDQLFTDIQGARKLGIYSVYVRPFSKEALYMLIKRYAEKVIFRLTQWR